MKRAAIVAAVVLSLVFAVSAFAIEGSQPPGETAPNFEQMKADHLKKLDDRMTSLQKEKVCVQAAKNQDDLRACRSTHKADMKENRDEMRKRGGPGGPGGHVPPQDK
ncbi:MAG: hypothetical protein WA126_00370 [Thermodesulfovibrionales bacterium]